MLKTIIKNNGIEVKINIKTDVKINEQMEDDIYKALCNAFWYEDDIKGLIALDTPINKDSTFWLENIKADVLYGENDKILSMEINCKMFDNGKLPDMEAIRKSKILAKSIINQE